MSLTTAFAFNTSFSKLYHDSKVYSSLFKEFISFNKAFNSLASNNEEYTSSNWAINFFNGIVFISDTKLSFNAISLYLSAVTMV